MTLLSPRTRLTVHIASLLVAVLLLIGIGPAWGQSTTTGSRRSATTQPIVTVTKPAVSVPVDGQFNLTVRVLIDEPTSYLESRVQVRHPGGRLLYQKTEVRNDVATGTVDVAYSRPLGDLTLEPAAYPIEVRVRSDAGGTVREWVVDDVLLVHASAPERVPVAIVARIDAPPSTDPEGRFAVDPARYDDTRKHAADIARLVLANADARLSIAIPSFLLEEWARLGQGYETAGPEGVRRFEEDSDVSRDAMATLELLRDALATERLELVDAGYGAPDIDGLAVMDRLSDLEADYERAASGYRATLETSAAAGALTYGAWLAADAIPPLAARDMDYAIVSPAALASAEETPPSGVYRIEDTPAGTSVTALLLDSGTGTALREADIEEFTRLLFARSVSEESQAPIIALVEFGPGRPARPEDLADIYDRLGAVPWARSVTAGDAAATGPVGELTLPDGGSGSTAPGDYWEQVGLARLGATALVGALEQTDDDARAAEDASLLAASGTWSGPDDRWSSADRGRAFSSAAQRISSGVFDAVHIAAQPITLSSAKGDVPISVVNDSDKTLTLEIRARASNMSLPEPEPQVVIVRPQDNFVTIPVDLESSLAGALDVELVAGDLLVDETTIEVRASYLDRLVIVGGISLLLAAMLLFIRYRVRQAESAGTMNE